MNLGRIVTISSGVVVIVGALTVFFLDTPKFASQGYVDSGQIINDGVHKDFAGELKSFRQQQLEGAIIADERRAGDLEATASQFKLADPNADVSVLLETALGLRRGVDAYDAELKALRSK